MMSYTAIAATLIAAGLAPRGGFIVRADDGVPPRADGRVARTLILAGNAGSSMWPAFSTSPELQTAAHPLDAWTRRVLSELAAELGAAPLFPFTGPPYLPFQRWAMRAEPVYSSPLGLLIHPEFGLWHAYRGALAFADEIVLPARDERPSPCATCVDRPCLSSCPVGAFSSAGYDVGTCATNIAVSAGASCMTGGCLARHACPVGRGFAYEPEQQRFHMQAFLRSRRGRA